MLMLKIYRPRWTQCDDNTLHDPLGMVMAGGGNDDLPWLYTQPLQNIGGC